MSERSNQKNKTLLKLRDIRRAKGMSLNSLADKVGIDYQRVGRMERGETQVTVEMLQRISTALHVPVSTLLGETNMASLEAAVSENALPKKNSLSLIPFIYEKMDRFCDTHDLLVEPKVKVYLATAVFNAVEEMRSNLQDDGDRVRVLFELLDAIFERLVLSKADEDDKS